MQRLGKYQLLEQIGAGGFGEVWKGFDPYIKRPVAIKTCSSHSEEIRSRFFKEAEIAGNLHHRNVTTVYDFGVERELPYLIQEYLSGEDLDVKIKRRDFLPYAEKLLYLIQIARGLAYAHEMGVIHRDIKPANVRILEDGTTKIMDFGIAKLAQEQTGLTQTGMTLGTAAYLSPEQIRGEAVDSRSDIFSFGVLAYELLTFERPFKGDQISAVLYQLLNVEPPKVDEIWPSAPLEMSDLVQRCLDKDPRGRPTDGAHLTGQLEEVQRLGKERSGAYGAGPTAPDDAPTVRLDSSQVATEPGRGSTQVPALEMRPAGRPPTHPGTHPGGDPNAPASPDFRQQATGTGATRSLGDIELTSITSPGTREVEPPPTYGASIAASAPSDNKKIFLLAGLAILLLVAAASGWWLGNRRDADPSDFPGGTEQDAAQAGDEGASSSAAGGPGNGEIDGDGSAGDGPGSSGATDETSGSASDPSSTPGTSPAEPRAEPEPAKPEPGRLLIAAPTWTGSMWVRIGQGANRALVREISLELPPGTYNLTFGLAEGTYQAESRTRVSLAAGATKRVQPSIAAPGRLTVRPFPGRPQGEVILAGEAIGSSPLQRYTLAPGRHVVEVRPKGSGEAETSPIPGLSRLVEVRSGSETVVTFDLAAGNMRVTNKALP